MNNNYKSNFQPNHQNMQQTQSQNLKHMKSICQSIPLPQEFRDSIHDNIFSLSDQEQYMQQASNLFVSNRLANKGIEQSNRSQILQRIKVEKEKQRATREKQQQEQRQRNRKFRKKQEANLKGVIPPTLYLDSIKTNNEQSQVDQFQYDFYYDVMRVSFNRQQIPKIV